MNLTTLLIVSAVMLVMMALLLVLVKMGIIKVQPQGKASDYESRGNLMTLAEVAFFNALKAALGVANYHIHSKVRMADIVEVKKGLERKKRFGAFNKISAKHVDFVLTNPADATIYAVVELDDRSHQRQSRQKSDQFKNETFVACGIPVIRFPVQSVYPPEEIITKVNAAFGR